MSYWLEKVSVTLTWTFWVATLFSFVQTYISNCIPFTLAPLGNLIHKDILDWLASWNPEVDGINSAKTNSNQQFTPLAVD